EDRCRAARRLRVNPHRTHDLRQPPTGGFLMGRKAVNELLKRRAEIKSLLLALAAKADAEQDGQFTEEQKAQADALLKESVEINGKLQRRAADDELRKAINELGGELNLTG